MPRRTLPFAVVVVTALGCGGATTPAADGGRAIDERSSELGASQPPAELAPLLEAHNDYRAKHCAPPLVWSAELATAAQRWADELRARRCAFEHSRTSYGENLAAGTSAVFGPREAVRKWYEEIKDYRFGSGGFSMKTGHFTQVVWVGSQRLGCGTTSCEGRTIWVCNYDPPGNMEGQFQANVRPTTCKR